MSSKHRARLFPAVVAACLLLGPVSASAATWKPDKAHTNVTFRIRHFLTKVEGRFNTFDGTVTFDPANPDTIKVEGTIDAASINTNNEKRDTHLRSADFFDVAKFPQITFSAGELTDVDAAKRKGKLHGNLTLHGVTKPVVLDVEWLGTAKTDFDEVKGGVVASTTINRKDYGIVWNQTLDSGGVVLGDDVDIELNAELNQQEQQQEKQ